MIKSSDALLIFRKWKDENCNLVIRGNFGRVVLTAEGCVSEVLGDRVSFSGLNGVFLFTLESLDGLKFEYAERKDLPSDRPIEPEEVEESGLVVVDAERRIALLFVARPENP